jgi:hypothetical protein
MSQIGRAGTFSLVRRTAGPAQGDVVGRSRSYATSPDGRAVLDVDRGSGDASTKLAAVMSVEEARGRRDERGGARDLDTAVESMPGLNRQQRDRERAMPRDVTGEVPDPRMERTLPGEGVVRVPMSARQRSARSVTKRVVQDAMPATQYTAVSQLVTDPGHWQRTNDALSDAAGDVQQLDDTQIARVQRVDRAIQAYEKASNRSHVVYANVQMPKAINVSNLAGFTRNTFTPGATVAFDRFTAGAHNLHQIERTDADAHRTAVFEIQTRRGAYLGRSTSSDNTSHLLPRGLQLRVVGTHTATYVRPDGTTGQRDVIQLTD